MCKSNLKKINPQRKTIKNSHFGDWKCWSCSLFTVEKNCRPVLQQNAWQNSDSGHIIDERKSSQNQLIWYLSHDLHNALLGLYFSQLPFFPQLLTAGSGPAKDPPTWGYLADATLVNESGSWCFAKTGLVVYLLIDYGDYGQSGLIFYKFLLSIWVFNGLLSSEAFTWE